MFKLMGKEINAILVAHKLSLSGSTTLTMPKHLSSNFITKASNQTNNQSKFHVPNFFYLSDSSGKQALKFRRRLQNDTTSDMSGYVKHTLIFNN